MIVTRFLNINNLIVLIFSYSYFFYLIKNNNLIFPKLYLTFNSLLVIFAIIIFGKNLSNHMPLVSFEKAFYNSIIWINFPIMVVYSRYINFIENKLINYSGLKQGIKGDIHDTNSSTLKNIRTLNIFEYNKSAQPVQDDSTVKYATNVIIHIGIIANEFIR